MIAADSRRYRREIQDHEANRESSWRTLSSLCRLCLRFTTIISRRALDARYRGRPLRPFLRLLFDPSRNDLAIRAVGSDESWPRSMATFRSSRLLFLLLLVVRYASSSLLRPVDQSSPLILRLRVHYCVSVALVSFDIAVPCPCVAAILVARLVAFLSGTPIN